jgi:hypothetical protein
MFPNYSDEESTEATPIPMIGGPQDLTPISLDSNLAVCYVRSVVPLTALREVEIETGLVLCPLELFAAIASSLPATTPVVVWLGTLDPQFWNQQVLCGCRNALTQLIE